MAEYFLTVKTPTNKKIGYITEFYKLEYFRTEKGVGSLYVTLPQEKYSKVNFEIDGRLEIWRNAASSGPSLAGETQWLIRLIRNKIDEQGKKILHILAYDAVQLLDRRIVAYVAGTTQALKNAMAADDLLKAIIRENMGALADETDRDLSDWLVVEDNTTSAPQVTMDDFAFQMVGPLLTAICEKAAAEDSYLSYDVIYSPGLQKFIFRTYVGQRGINRGKNTQNRLVFASTSDKFPVLGAGLSYASVETDATDERTFIYAGSRSKDTNVFYTTAYDEERINASPFGRYEDFIDAEDDTAEAISEEAYAWLQHKQRKVSVNGHIEQMGGLVYGRDFGFGDIVAFQYLGQIFDIHLDEVHVVVDENNKEDIRLFARNLAQDIVTPVAAPTGISRIAFDSYALIGSTYTLVRGWNRYLVFATGAGPDNTYGYYTSISVNGSPMTKLVEEIHTTRVQIWGLAIPDAWSGAVEVTYVHAGIRKRLEKSLFVGVDPANPVLASGGGGAASGVSSSLTLTCAINGYLLDVISLWTAVTPVKGANQTTDTGRDYHGASHYTVPVGGNLTMTWTFANARHAHAALSLRPYT